MGLNLNLTFVYNHCSNKQYRDSVPYQLSQYVNDKLKVELARLEIYQLIGKCIFLLIIRSFVRFFLIVVLADIFIFNLLYFRPFFYISISYTYLIVLLLIRRA